MFVQYEKSYYLCSVIKQVIMAKDHLSTEELELIEAIRNVRRAYPNGYDELLYYAQQLFDELVEMPPVDE